jgi:arylsulfatase A-like enzyme
MPCWNCARFEQTGLHPATSDWTLFLKVAGDLQGRKEKDGFRNCANRPDTVNPSTAIKRDLMKTLPYLLPLLLATPVALSAAPAKPNVVYILADDVGWGDLSVHGGGVPTPHIDRLFAQGVELSQFIGWCVCSPTRAMLLTGRHPIRVGTAPEVGGELAREETTIAEGFKANGYRTGVFGKWHNGEDPDTPAFQAVFAEAFKNMPNKTHTGGHGANAHGFDEAWVYYGGGADYFTRRTVQGRGPVSWWHNTEFRGNDEGYTDDLVTQRALAFIRENTERPFFCYIPFHIAHAPLQAKDEDLAAIDPKQAAELPSASGKTTPENKRIHAAMLHAMDKNVAALRAELDRLGLSENTILVFTSDNGAMEAGSSLPLRGHKHTIYDGGVRLPTAIFWPRGGLTGGRKWEGLCGALDMFPTLMAMTGSTLPPTRPLDGRNVWPALRENQASPVENYYWVWHGQDAIRTDQWKLHRYFDRFELYDIRKDESESNNVAGAHADVVKSLAAQMDAWADSLGVALSHQPAPARYHVPAAPEGEVLAVTVTVTDRAKPGDRLVLPVANWSGTHYATDWIEYDVAFSPRTSVHNPWFSPLEGNNRKPMSPLFKRGDGVDQFGRDQTTGPGIAAGTNVWEHRIIGLASTAPGPLGKQGVVFAGGQPGTYTIYIDNLRIRRAGGATTPLWTSGRDTRVGKVAADGKFKDVRVRTVDVAEVRP